MTFFPWFVIFDFEKVISKYRFLLVLLNGISFFVLAYFHVFTQPDELSVFGALIVGEYVRFFSDTPHIFFAGAFPLLFFLVINVLQIVIECLYAVRAYLKSVLSLLAFLILGVCFFFCVMIFCCVVAVLYGYFIKQEITGVIYGFSYVNIGGIPHVYLWWDSGTEYAFDLLNWSWCQDPAHDFYWHNYYYQKAHAFAVGDYLNLDYDFTEEPVPVREFSIKWDRAY